MKTNDTGAAPEEDMKTILARHGQLVERAAEALAFERKVMREFVLMALDSGMSEAEVVRLSGMSKPTVRAWQGKK